MATALSGQVTPGFAQETVAVGNFVDFSSGKPASGKDFGQAKIDAVEYINRHGGINGKMIDLLTVDYGAEVLRALEAYEKWKSQSRAVAVLGWSDGDAEALAAAAAADETPYFAASYAASLTDPQGRGQKTGDAAPYSFFYGPSSSDAVRALVQWAAQDWRKKQGGKNAQGKPKYIHMGDSHPYSTAPRRAGEDHARDLGFDVLPEIRYSMAPDDFSVQCSELKQSGADYAFLANTAPSNTALLKSCAAAGVKVQFLANIWGFDEHVMKAAGEASDGVVWVMGAAKWGDQVPGMKLVEEISEMSDPNHKKYRAIHYLRGLCSVFLMKEAMEWADRNGGLSGANIKAAMYQKKDWVPKGLEGVCHPATWSDEDHRGVIDVEVYRGRVRDTEGDISELISKGAIRMEQIFSTRIPRKLDWLGW